jgi:hypothetical protein
MTRRMALVAGILLCWNSRSLDKTHATSKNATCRLGYLYEPFKIFRLRIAALIVWRMRHSSRTAQTTHFGTDILGDAPSPPQAVQHQSDPNVADAITTVPASISLTHTSGKPTVMSVLCRHASTIRRAAR